jgi:omega-6 fatty acid desaturase (delta-12 desaturase)
LIEYQKKSDIIGYFGLFGGVETLEAKTEQQNFNVSQSTSRAPAENLVEKDDRNWRPIVAKYQIPSLGKSIWQSVNSIGPYLALLVACYFTVSVSWLLTVSLASLAGLFLVRIFIIFHDCGHGSFFRSKKANNVLGFITGIMTFTPYRYWRWQHAVHHGTSGNLDHRGTGDIWTMTVNEYLNASWWIKLRYRISRNPIVVFFICPLLLFWVYQRFAFDKASTRDRRSVLWMNLSLLVYVTAMSLLFGFWNYFFIQFILTLVSGTSGVWLFYVQHQFEDTYWRKAEEWDYLNSAMQGSSYYKLPKVLQWFSGNIGFHHIHHLSSRIPNYNLEACHNAEPFFSQVPELTLRKSWKSMSLRLWDEEGEKLVGYRHLKGLRVR